MNTEENKKKNNVTLFSNGIGHFRRAYTVSSKVEEISIPFKSNSIGDVASSLQVFGKVKLNTPPSFTPANSFTTSLRIDQNDALKSMIRQLSGSKLSLLIRGVGMFKTLTLVGLNSETVIIDGQYVVINQIIVMNENGGINKFLLDDVQDISFESGVQSEIEKSLKSNFQKIKPNSTILDLSISSLTDEQVQAIVQYTIPVAAWKMRYAIREDNGTFLIEGAAIIDNNTDEDWDDFTVSVVTGNPISFSTDIANVIIPMRKMVNLVENYVQGNVEVEDGTEVASFGAASPNRSLRKASLGYKTSVSNYASFGLSRGENEEDVSLDSLNVASQYLAAEAPGVDSKDVGDFCVFTSKSPITISAHKSAIVPMFSKPLDSAGVLLLYKESNNHSRPYRAIKFKNETEYTLGRGKTVIYNEGLFSGECVLENTKPSENRMLPHCLENGVKVVKENKGYEVHRNSIKISDGVGVTEDIQRSKTSYTISNKKNESFNMALEHSSQLANSNTSVEFSGVDIKEKEKLVDGNGWRIYFQLKEKESVTIEVLETAVISVSSAIGNNFNWIRGNIIDTKTPIAADAQIKKCIDIQKQIDDIKESLNVKDKKLQELESQVERVRENLNAVKNNSEIASKWTQDLDTTETEIRKINKTDIPKLNLNKKDLSAKLAEEIKKITVSWKDN